MSDNNDNRADSTGVKLQNLNKRTKRQFVTFFNHVDSGMTLRSVVDDGPTFRVSVTLPVALSHAEKEMQSTVREESGTLIPVFELLLTGVGGSIKRVAVEMVGSRENGAVSWVLPRESIIAFENGDLSSQELAEQIDETLVLEAVDN